MVKGNEKGRWLTVAQNILGKELSAKEILRETISLYANNVVPFLFLYLSVAIIIGLLNVVSFSVIGFRSIALLQSANEISASIQTQIIILVAFLILFSVINNFVYSIRDGASVLLTSNCLISSSCNFRSTISFVLPKATPLFVTELLVSTIANLVTFLVFRGIVISLTTATFIALIVSFSLALVVIAVAVMLLLTIPTIVLENKSFFASLSRSKTLASYNFSKAFFIWLASWSVSLLAGFVSGTLLLPFDERIATVLSQVVLSIISPIFTISITLLYYSMLFKEKTFRQVKS